MSISASSEAITDPTWFAPDPQSMLNPCNEFINRDVLGKIFSYIANPGTDRLSSLNAEPIIPYLQNYKFTEETIKDLALFKRLKEGNYSSLTTPSSTPTNDIGLFKGPHFYNTTYSRCLINFYHNEYTNLHYPVINYFYQDKIKITKLAFATENTSKLNFFWDQRGYLFIARDGINEGPRISSLTHGPILQTIDIFNLFSQTPEKAITTLYATERPEQAKPSILDFGGLSFHNPFSNHPHFSIIAPPDAPRVIVKKTKKMSNIQAVLLALVPCFVEIIERDACSVGNMAWYGLAKAVKYSRNALYFGVALTAIGAVGAAIGTTGAVLITGIFVATLGVGITTLSAKKLYDATTFIQSTVNTSEDPS